METRQVITLRNATPHDRALLEHWDLQPHVIESDPNDDWNWQAELHRNPEWREQLIAELHGIPIGFIQIIDPAKEESHYWGSVSDNLRAIDIWIGEAQHLGKGFGTAMMKSAIDRCFRDSKVTAVLVDPLESNVRAHRFYERLGFERFEKRQFGNDLCLIFQLDRHQWQQVQT